jgi:hypothetical protein
MYGVLDLVFKPTADGATPDAGKAEAIVRGDTYALELAFWTDAVAETGPIAITGSVTAQIRAARLTSSTGGAALADFAVVVSGAGNNIVTISLTPAQTVALPAAGFWDVQSVDAGVVTTWLAGKVKILDDVTRVA